mgnify:CR=1 FL=1
MNKVFKKFLTVFLSVVFALSLVGLVACNKKDDTKPGPGPDPSGKEWGIYFPIPEMNEEKKLLVVGADLDVGLKEGRNELITLSAIQGLSNRDEVTMYLNYKLEKDGQFPNDYWLQDMVDNYGITTETMSFEQAIEHYKEMAGENAGFVTYSVDYDPVVGTDDSRSLTAAINMCAIRGWIPVEKSLKDTAIEMWGLTEKLDATEMTDQGVFEDYKDEFDNSILIQQRPMENKDFGLPMVGLRDYAIANKFFTFYDDGLGQTTANYRKEVHAWAKPNKPILGWGPGDEGEHISYASEAGQFPIPSDYSFNLSVTSADVFQEGALKQKNQFEAIEPEEGKHYVAIGRSDGDNITTWQTEFVHSLTDFGSPDRGEGQFPMAWSISPALSEIFPALMRDVYRDSNEYDYFIAPVSGQAYMYPTVFPDKYKEDYFDKLDLFLEKADLRTVCILDHGQQVILSKNIANYYASAEHLTGGFVFNGYNYKGGNGAVVWSDNGKPFVAPKESLWQEQPGEVVARIGTYWRDYTRIEGYTYLNLHPWSHTYQDVEYVVNELRKNPAIEIITPDQMIDMITKYVPHTDVTSPSNVDPSLEYKVPVDPLDNKFLEGSGTEDWKATSGTIERVTKSVGGALKEINGLQINGIGEKTYTMPNEEYLQVGFDYVKQSGDTSIKVEMEIGGVTKVVYDNLPVRAADGVSNIVIPVWNYFTQSEYGGKEAKIRVEVLGSTANGVVITNVKTQRAEIADPASNGNKLEDKKFTTTEDWVISTFAKNAAVKIDNERLMLDGSDGWTGFYDDNINSSIYKTFTLPEDMNKAEISVKIESSNTGTAVNVVLVVNGKVYQLSEGFINIAKSEIKIFNTVINDEGGANCQIIIMQRDSKVNSGIGECAYLNEFKVSAPTVDPYYNTFAGSLEDWGTDPVNAVWENGMAKITASGSMNKTITMPEIESIYSTVLSFRFKAAEDSTVAVTLKAVYGSEEYVLKTVSDVTSTEFADFVWTEADASNPAMSKQEVKLIIEVTGTGSVYIDDFKVTDEKNLDPYNNTFESGLEDWKQESVAGWELNCIRWGASGRLEASLNNYGGVDDKFEAVAIKEYTLPNSTDITISFDAAAPGGYQGQPQGGSVTMTIEIDGAEYTLLDHETVNTENAFPSSKKFTVKLAESEALSGVEYAGKVVKVRLKFNDEGYSAGIGVEIYIDNFVTSVPVEGVDAYNNTFEKNLEDWTTESTSGWSDNGGKWGPSGRMEVELNGYGQINPEFEAVMIKEYTLPNSSNITISFDASAPTGYDDCADHPDVTHPQGGSVTMTIEIGGTEYVVLDKQIVNTENASSESLKVSVNLSEVEALSEVEYAGKEVKLRLKFNDEGFAHGVGVLIFIDNFVTTAA